MLVPIEICVGIQIFWGWKIGQTDEIRYNNLKLQIINNYKGLVNIFRDEIVIQKLINYLNWRKI